MKALISVLLSSVLALASGAVMADSGETYVRASGQLGPGRGTIIIDIAPAPGGELTEDAPLIVEARGDGLSFPERIKTRLDPAKLPIRLPVDVADGALGPAHIELSYYWCRDGKAKSCNPERARLTVGLRLDGDAPGGEAHFTHTARAR